MRRSFRSFLLLAAAVAGLSGCQSDKTNNCPPVSSLVETSVATIFKPGTTSDASNILYTVEIVGSEASCDVDKQAVTASSGVDVHFRATRGPNGGAVHYRVPYFVAISQADRILAKRQMVVEFGFEPGQTTAAFSDTVRSVSVTAARDKKTFDYVILVGLQLSKGQLQYNRASGRLNP